MRVYNICFVTIGLFLIAGSSCKKFVETDPPKTQLVTSSVFSNDATAKSSLDGIYSTMMQGSGFASGSFYSITALAGLSADELTTHASGGDYLEFNNNNLTVGNSKVKALWGNGYNFIFASNSVLEGLNGSTQLSNNIKEELTGEAKFIRAFCYFYLTNLFGDIPLVTTSDYKANSIAPRIQRVQVYLQIISDLLDASQKLPNDYSFEGGERIRPNAWAAKALLARVYLYLGDWADAQQIASSVIDQAGLFSLDYDFDDIFLMNSSEAIWQLRPVVPGYNTWEGSNFILTSAPNSTSSTLSTQLLSAFEAGDQRRSLWVDSLIKGANTYFYPFKYKVKTGFEITEYSMVLRLAEQYLIRAEAKLRQNDLEGAMNDINTIRTRALLIPISNASSDQILSEIVHQRQVELFTEWGARWLDLKRFGIADSILSKVKVSSWQAKDTLYPIPISEINTNPNLTQNPGY